MIAAGRDDTEGERGMKVGHREMLRRERKKEEEAVYSRSRRECVSVCVVTAA